MRVSSKPKTLIMFAILLVVTSCHASSCDRWNNAPRTEYYFQAGEISFALGTTSQVGVLDFTRELMNHQSYFMNLWRVDADDSDERYKLEPPRSVANHSQFNNYVSVQLQSPANTMSGPLLFDGVTLGFDLEITAADSAFTNLSAYGTCRLDDAQRLIKQVRLPAWSNNTSDDIAEVSWTLAGDYEGDPFSVSFTQVFRGKSRYPVYPDRF